MDGRHWLGSWQHALALNALGALILCASSCSTDCSFLTISLMQLYKKLSLPDVHGMRSAQCWLSLSLSLVLLCIRLWDLEHKALLLSCLKPAVLLICHLLPRLHIGSSSWDPEPFLLQSFVWVLARRKRQDSGAGGVVVRHTALHTRNLGSRGGPGCASLLPTFKLRVICAWALWSLQFQSIISDGVWQILNADADTSL